MSEQTSIKPAEKRTIPMNEINFNVLPVEKLKSLAQIWKLDLDDDKFALKLDEEDPLR